MFPSVWSEETDKAMRERSALPEEQLRELVARLRRYADPSTPPIPDYGCRLLLEAAEALEVQEAEVRRLREENEALRWFVAQARWYAERMAFYGARFPGHFPWADLGPELNKARWSRNA